MKPRSPSHFVWAIILLAGHTVFSANSGASATENSEPQLSELFDEQSVQGALVIESLDTGKRWVHNPERLSKPYIPASTFKIASTLMFLELGTVADVDRIIPWDGKQNRIRSWNKPQTFRQAIQNSTVPIYQRFARHVGLLKMKQMISRLNYGNGQIGSRVDRFWLEGPLRISPNQQIEFLKRLHAQELEFSIPAQRQTIELLLRDHGEDFSHYGKTGWEIASTPAIGWYVGWHETKADTLFFALNMDMTEKHHRHTRTQIVGKALRLLQERTNVLSKP